MSRKKIANWIMGIFGFLLAIFWLFPFYLMISNSLKEKKEIFTNTIGWPQKLTFANYPQAFEDLEFVKTLFNSLLITVVSVCLIIATSSLAAYALQRTKSKFSAVVLLIFVAAMLIPFQSVMIPLVSIFGKAQMLNRGGLMFMYIGFGSSMSIFLYHGALKSIPKALDEAAIIDGATRLQIYRYIILPILRPITITVAVLNTMWIWNDYLLPSLVINKEGMQTIPLKMFFFFGEYTKQWHLALAGLTIAIIPVIIFYFIMQKQIIKGVSEGAVK